MSDKEWKGLAILLGCLSFPVILVITTLWGGWVLSVVWNWFMPQIFGLPQLTLIQAIAVSLVIGWLTKATVPNQTKDGEGVAEGLVRAYVTALAAPFFVLIFAYIIKWFMG